MEESIRHCDHLQILEHVYVKRTVPVLKGGGALCAGNAVALLVFGPVMPY